MFCNNSVWPYSSVCKLLSNHKKLLILNINPKRKHWNKSSHLSSTLGSVSPLLFSYRVTSMLSKKASVVGNARRLLVRSSYSGLGVMQILVYMR